MTSLAWVALTVGIYALAESIHARTGKRPWAHPVLITVCVLIPTLQYSQTPAQEFADATRPISFFLGPAVVSLGWVLYRQWTAIVSRWFAILISLSVGSTLGVLSAAGIARWMGASSIMTASIAPKSVTSPIAMAIAEKTGGNPAIAAFIILWVGIFGAVVGPYFLYLLKIKNKFAIGLALGAAAHGVGTSQAVQMGPEEAAASSIALCIQGVLTALVTPFLLHWMGVQ